MKLVWLRVFVTLPRGKVLVGIGLGRVVVQLGVSRFEVVGLLVQGWRVFLFLFVVCCRVVFHWLLTCSKSDLHSLISLDLMYSHVAFELQFPIV